MWPLTSNSTDCWEGQAPTRTHPGLWAQELWWPENLASTPDPMSSHQAQLGNSGPGPAYLPSPAQGEVSEASLLPTVGYSALKQWLLVILGHEASLIVKTMEDPGLPLYCTPTLGACDRCCLNGPMRVCGPCPEG